MGMCAEHMVVTGYVMSPLCMLRTLPERAHARGGTRPSEVKHARQGGMETHETERTTTNSLGGTQE